MGKTWKRRAGGRKPGKAARHGCGREAAVAEEVPSLECVLERLADRMSFVVRGLVISGLIRESEAEDYLSELKVAVCTAYPRYRPRAGAGVGDRRTSASIFTWMRVVLDNRMASIVNEIRRHRTSLVEVPISCLSDEEHAALGYLPEGFRFSDGCRSIRELDFRLDYNSFVGLLTAAEKRVLDLRLCQYTLKECGERLMTSEASVRRRIAGVQRKAVACGFVEPATDSPARRV